MKQTSALISIGQLAILLGVCVGTVRRWCREGILTETSRTVGNHRRFAFDAYKHLIPKPQENRRVVGYARVSSHDQRNDLDTQAKRLQDYGCDEVITI